MTQYAAMVFGAIRSETYGPLDEAEARRVVNTTLGGGLLLRREMPGDEWEIVEDDETADA